MLRQLGRRKINSDRMKDLEEGIKSLAVTEHELAIIAKQQSLLKSLNFRSRLLRHYHIPVAHTRTFQWLLDSSIDARRKDRKEYSLLAEWLRRRCGILWVSGKAGSGKSTLMKYIADHDQKRRLLEEWAGPAKLVIASHYFWTAEAIIHSFCPYFLIVRIPDTVPTGGG